MGFFNKLKSSKAKDERQSKKNKNRSNADIDNKKQTKEEPVRKMTMRELYENKESDKKPIHKMSSAKNDYNKKKITKKQTDLEPSKNINHNKVIQDLAYRVLIKPLITEKVTSLGKYNKYVFVIDKKANKIMVKKAIEQIYGLKPLSVNISYVKGKKVRYANKLGKRKNWKKAIITLAEGQEIKVYEGV